MDYQKITDEEVLRRAERACELGVPYPLTDTTFLVLSSQGTQYYVVDMLEGSCTCEDWKNQEEFKPKGERHICKHQIRVMFWYFEDEQGREACQRVEDRLRKEEMRKHQIGTRKVEPVADRGFYD